jgi:branched-chain amino acid transport system ATP-binding protein
MLEMQGVTAGYDGVPVLRDVSINVGRGELVGLLGANNAGKSTLINVISGTVPIMSGRLMFDGEDISGVGAQRRVELGLVQVPEGRLVFPQMSVRENLLLGGYNRKAPAIWTTSSRSSRDSESVSASSPARCRAASSRWSRSDAVSWQARAC